MKKLLMFNTHTMTLEMIKKQHFNNYSCRCQMQYKLQFHVIVIMIISWYLLMGVAIIDTARQHNVHEMLNASDNSRGFQHIVDQHILGGVTTRYYNFTVYTLYMISLSYHFVN